MLSQKLLPTAAQPIPGTVRPDDQAKPGLAIEVPRVTLPTGGGAIKSIDEQFKMNSSNGTSSFRVPVPISEGRNGFSPQLAFSYNSGAGNSAAGIGWSLDIPSIQRRTDKRLPSYNDAEDTFMFSGAEELVPAVRWELGAWVPDESTVAGFAVKRYRPRLESNVARIERIRQGTEVWWRVTAKDNQITYFGTKLESRIHEPADPERIFQWLPDFALDDQGNCIAYTYKAENFQGVSNTVSERNRLNGLARQRNLYLKSIRHGNVSPCYRDGVHAMLPPNYSGGYRFDTVLDYGEHHATVPAPAEEPGQAWQLRPDPFSAYRAGFEVRTYRRILRVLIFHTFPDLAGGQPCLVRSMDMSYTPSGVGSGQATELSYLTSITQQGYHLLPNGQYSSKSLPALEFDYQPLHWDNSIHTLDKSAQENLPNGAEGTYQWLDLWGEGIPGIFSEQAEGWFYKRNAGDLHEDGALRLEPAALVAPRPSFSGMAAGGALSLQDLEGNGQKQIVVRANGLQGYFELSDRLEWLPFQTFNQVMNSESSNPYQKMLDLNGDGKVDALISEENAFVWHEGLGKKGFGEAQRAPKPRDQEQGPALVFADQTQTVFLADMSGDGLQDIVRVRNGEVGYWPNLGYGRFGAKVTMENPPWFTSPDLFDSSRIHLGDLSGTGATDILYLGSDGCQAWLNLNGNAWSDPQPIVPFMSTERPNTVQVLDILGNGTSCIVWSSSLPAHAHAPLRYIDLMAGKKPHLLRSYVNNLGKEVKLSYKSSTWFYNRDRSDGKPWLTRLAFPVHCMRKTETIDHVEGSRFVSEYSYHHGYFDHDEREFRGFGRVDQLDTETYDHWVKSGAANVVDAALHQAPVLTKNWYHLGAGADRARLLGQFATEYWSAEMARQVFPVAVIEPELPEARLIAAPHLPAGAITGFNEIEWREAMRACKGMVLRREVFGLDAPQNPSLDELKLQLSPYTVETHNCVVEMLQPARSTKNAVFVVKESEALTLRYDRVINDPAASHTLNVRVDDLGNILESAKVVYGRKLPDLSLPAETVTAQGTTQITYQRSIYGNDSVSPTDHRLRLLTEQSSFEIKGLAEDGPLYKISDFDAPLFHVLTQSTPVEYHQYAVVPPAGTVHRRLLSQERTYYLDIDLQSPLPLHQIGPRPLIAEKYKMAFTAGLLTDIYAAKTTPARMTEGRYVHLEGDTNWWIRSGFASYLNLGEAPAAAAARFYTPVAVTDPHGARTTLSYASNDFLLLQTTTDAAQNTTTALEFDLRILMPRRTRDANLNLTEALYDELGRVKAMARLGKGNQADDLIGRLAWEDAAETLALDNFSTAVSPSALAVAAQPLLQHATMRFVYDWGRYKLSGGLLPAYSATISREQYFAQNASSPLQLKFEYANAGGKVTMTKVQAEPGRAKQVIVNPDDTIVVLEVDTSSGPTPENRWVGTGRKVLNNKGNVVKEYEPYFSVTHQYESYKELVEAGRTLVTYYDPPGRPVKVLYPEGNQSRVIIESWRKQAWDRNDSCLESDWYFNRINHQIDAELLAAGKNPMREAEAAAQSAAHAGTPATEHLDAQGRAVLSIAHNGKDALMADIFHQTRMTLDIEGHVRVITDPLLRDILTTKYDMLGNAVHQATPDTGRRWKLLNTMAESIYDWDDRGHELHTEHNDALHRVTQKTVTGGDGVNLLNHVIERVQYGEGLLNDQDSNLRGQPAVLYDTAGKLESLAYDLDGHLAHSRRRFAQDYRAMVNWPSINPDALLEAEAFEHTFEFDALGRVIRQSSPDGSTYLPAYNAGNLLQSVEVERLGAAETFVQNIDYNEKGQRVKILFGNDVTADYGYDSETFRVRRIHSYRSNSEDLQDLFYTYDAVGNLTHLEDKCIPVVFWDNQKTTGLSTYTYDPLYRLTHATGREHAAAFNASALDNWDDLPFMRDLSPNDPFVWRPYSQTYRYDAVGNLEKLTHTAQLGSYVRDYGYVPGTNRLDHTTVGGQNYNYQPHAQHGFATSMPQLSLMQWNFRDELQATAKQAVNPGTPETPEKTWYVYDGKGERLRKVTHRRHADGAPDQKKEERYYLGTVELYRSYDNGGALDVERYTLHVSDDKQRIAMVDNRTQGEDGQPDAHLVRYQCPNHLSSASMELDQTGRVVSYEEHHPFGTTSYLARNATINAAAKRYRFTAMERDEESGLEYHSARYYAPWLGRWIAADKLADKQVGNRFAYVSNNPLKFIDTNGMFEESAHGALTYRLAIAAGFEPADAATIALATAAMDHDPEDKPGGDENAQAYIDGVLHIFSGSTQDKHFPSQDTAMARVQADITGGFGERSSQAGLIQFGRDLHSLEDVGTRKNPGPHSRGTQAMTADILAIGIGDAAISAILIGNAFGNAHGVSASILAIAGGILAALGVMILAFGFASIGVGHGIYTTERGRERGGGQSNWTAHVADQFYQDPKANTAQFRELYGTLQAAARARYGRQVDTNDAAAYAAIDALAQADTMEKIDAFLHGAAIGPGGSVAPSYADILSSRGPGAWTGREMDVTVEGDPIKYRDFYDTRHSAATP